MRRAPSQLMLIRTRKKRKRKRKKTQKKRRSQQPKLLTIRIATQMKTSTTMIIWIALKMMLIEENGCE